MLMKIPSDPMSFIGRNESDEETLRDEDPEREEKESEYGNNMKMKIGYLDMKARYLDPTFLMAWWNLREHIENYELNYFFEVCTISKSFSPSILCIEYALYTADESNHLF